MSLTSSCTSGSSLWSFLYVERIAQSDNPSAKLHVALISFTIHFKYCQASIISCSHSLFLAILLSKPCLRIVSSDNISRYQSILFVYHSVIAIAHIASHTVFMSDLFQFWTSNIHQLIKLANVQSLTFAYSG